MSNDLIYRQAAIDALGERPMVWAESDYELGARNQYDADVLALETLPSAQPDLSTYSDKLWRAAYERGKKEAEAEQGDEAIFWKKRAREYEDIIADLVTAQAKGIKLDSIEITGEGIIFKKSESERKRGKWIQKSKKLDLCTEWWYECSECGNKPANDRYGHANYLTAYCPNCGADMRGEQDE